MDERWEDWFEEDETLLWEGAPQPGIRLWMRNIVLGAFGIPFMVAGLMSSAQGLRQLTASDGPNSYLFGLFFFAFGIPFIAVGGGLAVGTWLEEYLKPRRIRYALSNRNGYIASRMWGRKMEVLPLRPTTGLEYKENRDGTGTVLFHVEAYTDSDGDRRTRTKGFENLADGREVFRLLRSHLQMLSPN